MKNVISILRHAPSHWVGDGFPVRSILSHHEHGATISPFLLLDYAAPYEFPPTDKPRGVERHPHRGFETVTLVYQGALAHRDSAGNSGVIGPGDVQWMTAASGVVHEEYHAPEFSSRGGTFQVVQLWVNLPAKHKMAAPGYQTLPASSIPVVPLAGGGGKARIIAGSIGDARGPARTFTPIQLFDVRVNAGARVDFAVPRGHMAGVLVLSGRLRFEDAQTIGNGEFALFDRQGEDVRFAVELDSTVLFLGGEPINEPISARGPFVMNTPDEIYQAISDYQSGRMGELA